MSVKFMRKILITFNHPKRKNPLQCAYTHKNKPQLRQRSKKLNFISVYTPKRTKNENNTKNLTINKALFTNGVFILSSIDQPTILRE